MSSSLLQCIVLLIVFMTRSRHIASAYNLAVISTNNAQFFNLNTDGLEIIGIANLGKQLYVVCVSNDTIFTFSAIPPYERVKTFSVQGMSPGDIVADPRNGRLYIMDWRPANEGGSRVWSVNPLTGSYEYYVNTSRWTGTLSLTPDKRVLGVSGNAKLNLYSTASGLTALSLPSSVVDPQHAIRTINGKFYVSQGWTVNQANRVVMLDSSANKVVSQFGSDAPGNGTQQLYWPRHLAIDPIQKNVFVADYGNRRVIQLNDRLNFERVLLSPILSASVGWPQRLMIHLPSSKLFVAMAETSWLAHN